MTSWSSSTSRIRKSSPKTATLPFHLELIADVLLHQFMCRFFLIKALDSLHLLPPKASSENPWTARILAGIAACFLKRLFDSRIKFARFTPPFAPLNPHIPLYLLPQTPQPESLQAARNRACRRPLPPARSFVSGEYRTPRASFLLPFSSLGRGEAP